MKFRALATIVLSGFALVTIPGCALFQKGRTQMVVVRSFPAGAKTVIDGMEVGVTPLKIKLPRTAAHTIEISKEGYESATATVLPTSSNYDKRLFRWGLDYDLGAAPDLTPEEVRFALRPTADSSGAQDPYVEMTARITQADALLASKEISADDHRYLVSKIVEFYSRR